MKPIGVRAPLAESETNNFSETLKCRQNLDIIALKTANQLMMKSATDKPSSSKQSSKTWGEENLYLWFVYGPDIVCNPTRKQ